MENKIGKFNVLLKEDKENREFNKTLSPDSNGGVYKLIDYYNLKDTHTFYLSFITNNHTLMLHHQYNPLIQLDEEDLEYFKKKYLPKLEDEMLQEIDKVIKKYKG